MKPRLLLVNATQAEGAPVAPISGPMSLPQWFGKELSLLALISCSLAVIG